jgi:hypothetical protein
MRKREEQVEIYVKEHPCTDIELIEEKDLIQRFDSNPWLCVYSLCIDIMLMNICFLSYICFYICYVCDFMVELKSERVSE